MIPSPPTKRKTTTTSPRTKESHLSHIMGYGGYVPGAFSSLGTNTREWLSGQEGKKRAAAANSDGSHEPCVGYGGHIPGFQHCSNSLLGRPFKEVVDQCWAEASPLYEADRLARSGKLMDGFGSAANSTAFSATLSQSIGGGSSSGTGGLKHYGTSIPPRSHRGWSPFQSTNRADFRNMWKNGPELAAPRTYYPDDMVAKFESRPPSARTLAQSKLLAKYLMTGNPTAFVEDEQQPGIFTPPTGKQQQQQFSQQPASQTGMDGLMHTARGGGTPRGGRGRPTSAGNFQWIQEESPLPRRSDTDVLAMIRSKLRSRVGSTGELRFAFQTFTNANVISFDQWCRALLQLGVNSFVRLSEARNGFNLADANHDGVIDFSEFVMLVMGRQSSGPTSENAGYLTERPLGIAKSSVRF